ncbi:MAG: hypothetical protein JWN38_563 [Candidatus Saccharibacteria bacterium]|nr:hypothetical protein [Candidatus Saccharibacteria bacterium]
MSQGLPYTLLTSAEGREVYNLPAATLPNDASEVELALAEDGVARIDMPLSGSDFERLTTAFDICTSEFPQLLPPYFDVDARKGHEAGYRRKDLKLNRSQQQIADPKNIFHFSELARNRWDETHADAPDMLRQFLDDGFEIQNILLGVVREHLERLEASHPNMSRAYFLEAAPQTLSFMRVLSYDGYVPHDNLKAVASPHYDLGGFTIQAYADAPGFWGRASGHKGPETDTKYYDTAHGQAYLFAGQEHAKLYGDDSFIKPLWHGVERVIAPEATYAPNRHAIILFTDTPLIDHANCTADTKPHLQSGYEPVDIPSQPVANERVA